MRRIKVFLRKNCFCSRMTGRTTMLCYEPFCAKASLDALIVRRGFCHQIVPITARFNQALKETTHAHPHTPTPTPTPTHTHTHTHLSI